MAGRKEDPASVSYFKLYKFASGLDIFLVALGTLAAIAHGLSYPSVIYQFGRINNAYGTAARSPSRAYHEVVKVVIIVACISIGVVFAAFLETTCWLLAGENITSKIKTRYLQALLSQDVAFFDMNVKTGDVVTAISSDMILIHDAVGVKIGALINGVSTFWSGLIISLVAAWRLGLLGLTATPLLLGAGGVYVALYTKFSAQTLAAYKEADSKTEQALSNIRTVYSHNGESKTLSGISSCLQQAVRLSFKTGLSKGTGLGFTFAVLYFSWALQFWYGGIVIKHGLVDAGTLYALILISLFAGRALGDTLRLLDPILKGKAAAVRLFEVIERNPETQSTDDVVPETLAGRIEFHNVTFAYPARPEVPVFKNLSLEIPQGETVALVGSSGSGKSSVVSLVQRFYDPQSGQVNIDGRDIKTLQVKWLRKQMGFVSQEPALFQGTIEQNIMFGVSGATREDVVRVSKLANADGFISQLPNGYNTQVGDRGLQLSGGQKQRVAIARAIIRKPGILLLDEATSALDSKSEFQVQRALDNIMKGQTTIVIAHRLSTVQNADKIIVFEKGSVVESGSHESLLQQGGTYAHLVKLQNIKTRSDSELRPNIRDDNDAVPETSEVLLENMQEGPRTPQVSKPNWASFTSLGRGAWHYIVLESFGACLSGLVTGFFPLFMVNILILFLKNQVHAGNKLILVVVGMGGIIFISSILQYFFGHKSGAMISCKLQEISIEGVLKNEVGWFDLEENNGAVLTARISSSSTVVRNILSDNCSILLQDIVAISLAVVIALVIHWRVALIALAALPIAIFGNSLGQSFREEGLAGSPKSYYERAAQIAGEATANIRTVLSLGVEEEIISGFKDRLLSSKWSRFRRSALLGLAHGIMDATMIMSSACQLWYGIYLVNKGKSEFEPVLRVVTIVNYTIVTCMELLNVIPDVFRGTAAISDLLKLASRASLIDPEENKSLATGGSFHGGIELISVSFAYPTRPQLLILSGVSLKVSAGETVALVGASGSGKSSVLALIQRFYDPSSGAILADGLDIRTLDLRWLRSHIGYVQQEPALFAGSIRENIIFGRERAASEAEVIEAATMANAHEFISCLPEGYETEVGERGVQLSGGQKQRIAIARAVMRSPTILLLDEATSALDSEAERIVQEAIDRVMLEGSRTTILVAHRLSTIQHADSIVVMQNGSVVERGSHSDLLANNGAYSSLLRVS